LSLVKKKKKKQGKKKKKNKLINFGQKTLYVIKKVIPEAHSNICGSYSLVPLAPSTPEVFLRIMLVVTPVTKASFLVDKVDAGRETLK